MLNFKLDVGFLVNVEIFGKDGILFKCACTIFTYSICTVYFSNMFNLPVHTVRPYTQEYSTRDWKQLQFGHSNDGTVYLDRNPEHLPKS